MYNALSWTLAVALSFTACRSDPQPVNDAGVSGDVDAADASDLQRGPEPLTAAEIKAFEDYCRALESAYQGWRDRCHPWAPGDLAPACFVAFDQVAQRRIKLRDEPAQPCLDALADSGCTRNFGHGVPECVGVLQPLVPNGEVCTPVPTGGGFVTVLPAALRSGHCSDGWCDSGCPRVCRPFREQGDECDRSQDEVGGERQCGTGLWCGAEGRCVPRVPVGSACTYDGECEDGLECLPGIGLGNVGATVSGPRTCETPLEIGATCDPNLDLCRHRSACVDGVCSAQVREGDLCGSGQGHAVCPADHFCMGSPNGQICTLQASTDGCLGQSWCLPGQTCEDRACVSVREPCWANADCAAGEWCDGNDPQAVQGGCVSERAPGAPCLSLADPTMDCADGLVCLEGKCTLVAASGEACAQLWTVCDGGLVCRQSGTCDLPAQRGEDCYPYATDICEIGLGCSCIDLLGSACTCEPLKPPGSPCFAPWECESKICEDGDGGGPVCQPGSCPL